MSEYTPDTDVVRDAYVEGQTDYTMPGHVSQAEHVARFDRWLAEVEREAAREGWEEGVATALNHAKRGSDGITLKLVTFDGDAWKNPYREN